jgi:hypothetical protein
VESRFAGIWPWLVEGSLECDAVSRNLIVFDEILRSKSPPADLLWDLLSKNCLRGIRVVTLVGTGIARAASGMDIYGIEQVRSSIAQWLFDFMELTSAE